MEVLDVQDGQVTVRMTPDAALPFVGLLPESGEWYAQMAQAPVPATCAGAMNCVTRTYELVFGDGPVIGEMVKADEYFFAPARPELALGTPVQELSVAIGAQWDLGGGEAIAWFVPPSSGDLVVVGVHGRGGAREEMLRLASIVVSQGHGMLIVGYRGDGVAPDSPDGLGHFGVTEWVDVAMAMRHPQIPADARFVMAGNSQGAALIAQLLRDGDIADRVDGIILDSPLIALDATMERQAQLAGIPPVLTRPVLESAYLVSRFRGFNFAHGEHVEFLAASSLPILLFHGPDDQFVPGEPSDSLAQRNPDIDYERAEGVDHVRFWNADPAAYAEATKRFLVKVTS
ncbi:MAG: alpha-beta hydrolase superfamily lysophospholipase [Glaciecola sp.]